MPAFAGGTALVLQVQFRSSQAGSLPGSESPLSSEIVDFVGVRKSIFLLPEQNSDAERTFRWIFEAVRTAVASASPPVAYWADAALDALAKHNDIPRAVGTWCIDVTALRSPFLSLGIDQAPAHLVATPRR